MRNKGRMHVFHRRLEALKQFMLNSGHTCIDTCVTCIDTCSPKPWRFTAQSIHARYLEDIAACTNTWSACTSTSRSYSEDKKLQCPCTDTWSSMYRYIFYGGSHVRIHQPEYRYIWTNWTNSHKTSMYRYIFYDVSIHHQRFRFQI